MNSTAHAVTGDGHQAAYNSIGAMVERYLARFPGEASRLAQLQVQLATGDAGLLKRSTMAGHITTSMLVVDFKARKVLLIAHGVYIDWMPPGGHYEGDLSLWLSAAREVLEETGICAQRPVLGDFRSDDTPVDIDTHPIPANPKKGEGDHYHHDFTFLASADSTLALTAQEEEVDGVRWVDVIELRSSPLERVRRLGAKLEGLFNTL